MDETLVVINFKNYPESTLNNADRLLNAFSEVHVPKGVKVVYSVSPVDLGLKKDFPTLELFSQHVDEDGPGASTGKITMESLSEIGIKGSLVNHSENRLPADKIRAIIEKGRKEGFTTVLCVESPEEAQLYARLQPSYIAYEPPELIGGDISVSSARPEIISDVVSICSKHNVPVLVGAGVKNRTDLQKSLELGAVGVLVASGIVKAPDPVVSLTSLISE